mgnify:CR=1 FL=1
MARRHGYSYALLIFKTIVMRIYKILGAGLLLITMSVAISCSSNTYQEATNKDIVLQLKFPQRALTRSVDDVANASLMSIINSVDLVLTKGQRAYIIKQLSNEEVQELKSTQGYTYQKASAEIDGVFLLINKPEGVTLKANQSVNEMRKHAVAVPILAIQPGATKESVGINNAVMVGMSTSFKEKGVNSLTGLPIMSTIVNVGPAISRIETVGMVDTEEMTVRNFKIKRIYLDNFISDNSDTANPIKINVGKDVDEALDAHFVSCLSMFDNGGRDFGSLPLGKTYAFHLFPQKRNSVSVGDNMKDASVKLLLKVQYDHYSKEGKLIEGNRIEYPTLRLAKSLAQQVDESVLDIESGLLYRIDLGVIDWDRSGDYDKDIDKFRPGSGGDTPNSKSKDIGINVDIEDWDNIEISPGL